MSSTTEKGSASSLVPRTVPMDAKLMVATDPGDVKKLKEVVNKEDAVAMVVVTVTSKKPSEEHQSPTGNINPLLLSSARRGFCGTLNVLLEKEDAEIPPRIVASTAPDVEQGVDLHRGASLAPGALLKGVTPDGDTALHVVAGSNGDGEHFLKYAGNIHHRDKGFLFLKNCRGDTPLHCAARAGNSKMVSHLIDLAGREGADMKLRLLRMENNRHETVVHEAVRFEKGTILGHKEKEALLRGADLAEEENNKDGCPGAPEEKNIVKLLMRADPDLANYPADGVSPSYLAILLEKSTIALTLYYMSDRKLSYSGADGQNALHVSVLRDPVMIEFLVCRNKSLSSQVDNDRSTPLHFASSTWNVHTSVMLQTIFTANPAALYQSDKDGSFPIHVAASVGAIEFFHGKCKDSVGLRDAKGRTFLHVAVEKRRLFLVYYACRTPSLAWILNMQDNDGNTALHLAIQARSLRMFCALFGNLEVNLNVPNNNGETPLDISRSKLPRGLNYAQNSENKICRVLESVWAKHGALRCDKTEEKYSWRVKPEDVDKESERLRNAAQSLITASVLIATMAFGATFALPRDYRVNDHTDGGAPVHAGSYVFDTFMMATTLAFICSSMGTIGFVFAATPMVSLFTRKVNFNISVFFMWSSVTCISIAFASGVYMVLASVAPSTAVAVCVITPVILLIASMEFIIKIFIFARPLCVRKGLLRGMLRLLGMHMFMLAIIFCPFVVTFGWAALARIHRHH